MSSVIDTSLRLKNLVFLLFIFSPHDFLAKLDLVLSVDEEIVRGNFEKFTKMFIFVFYPFRVGKS